MSGMSGLFNSTTLDVILGLVFVYLLLAIMCTTINEWLAGVLNTRSTNLAAGIKQLLDKQAEVKDGNQDYFLQKFYAHPLISGMCRPGKTGTDAHPVYIPSRTFATAVMDIATPNTSGAITYTDLESGLKLWPDGDVKKALLALIQNAHGDLGQAQKNIEAWFDDSMDRVSGWYKRKTQAFTVVIAIFLTIGANADTISIARTLWRNPTQRALLVQQAEKRSSEQSQTATGWKYDDPNKPLHPTSMPKPSKDETEALGSVLGWKTNTMPADTLGWLERILGWILTMIAVSLGAPFWFDILNKLVNIRNAGNKPATSDTEPKPGTAPLVVNVQGAPSAKTP
jgi:hypothetical protein